VHKEEENRGVPESGCWVTSFCLNRRNTATAEACSGDYFRRPGGEIQRNKGGNGEEGAVLLIGMGRASKRASIEWNLMGE
jgi:hypothetical protein